MTLMITGGAGFIGSNLIEQLLEEHDDEIVCVDKLVFPGSSHTIERFQCEKRFRFERRDIADAGVVDRLFAVHRPDAVLHLAAESHVDRSIDRPRPFIDSNVVGTFNLLDAGHRFWRSLPADSKPTFRFLHVSTDEVFGSLAPDAPAFREDQPYRPTSPYAASKAASDMLVRSWVHTYGFPALVTNCSNNFGPYQFPEKLIPLVILKALEGEALPVYGDGGNVRDWLYVEDHVRGLIEVLKRGRIGETYNIGGNNERTNIDVVRGICRLLDELTPGETPHERLISFVPDRPGHDRRYAIDGGKIRRELGWKPAASFDAALKKTVEWYIENQAWCASVMRNSYSGERLGLGVGSA